MSYTNTTAHYNLPQYVASDIPSILTDTNGAYSAIDAAIYAVADTATEAAADASEAKTAVVQAQADATQALTDAASAQSTANGAVTAAGTAQSTANTAVANASTAQATATQAVSDASAAQATADSISRRNLLDNPWFTVNQRGETSGTVPANEHKVDRWKLDHGSGGAGTWSLSSGIFTLTPPSTSWNMISQNTNISTSLDGETLTMSVKLSNNSIVSHTFTRTSSAMEQYTFTGGELRLTAIGEFQVLAYNGVPLSFKAVKLEIGSTSTLHLDTAPDYTTELLKCQRYFVRFGEFDYGTAVARSATNAYVAMYLPTELRSATPTISKSGTLTAYQGASDTIDVSTVSISHLSRRIMSLELVASGFTAGNALRLMMESGGYLDVSAEL